MDRLSPLATVRAGGTLLAHVARVMRQTWRVGLLTIATCFGAAFLVFPNDQVLLMRLHLGSLFLEPSAKRISYIIGFTGDYPTYNFPLALGFWLFGYYRGGLRWQRLALICFFGATLAGLFDDCLRLTLGRPRPDAGLPDAFYGIGSVWESRYQSFPSGHAAAVFGTAISLVWVHRGWGLATLLFALLVVWARLELNRHWPSDVAVGSLIGVYFGAIVGSAAQQLWFPKSNPGGPL